MFWRKKKKEYEVELSPRQVLAMSRLRWLYRANLTQVKEVLGTLSLDDLAPLLGMVEGSSRMYPILWDHYMEAQPRNETPFPHPKRGTSSSSSTSPT